MRPGVPGCASTFTGAINPVDCSVPRATLREAIPVVRNTSDWQAQFCFAAASVAAILQCQCAAMGFRNLAAENEANS